MWCSYYNTKEKRRSEAMSIWLLLLIVCGAGAVGGLINALISDNGFALPRAEKADSISIVRPGFIGNVVIGAVAAGVSWGLYGPLSLVQILPAIGNPSQVASMTLSTLVGAVLVGVGGARWLTNEVDKKLLKVAASQAAAAEPSPEMARNIAMGSPSQALNFAMQMGKSSSATQSQASTSTSGDQAQMPVE